MHSETHVSIYNIWENEMPGTHSVLWNYDKKECGLPDNPVTLKQNTILVVLLQYLQHNRWIKLTFTQIGQPKKKKKNHHANLFNQANTSNLM